LKGLAMMRRVSNTPGRLAVTFLLLALGGSAAWSISWWGKRDNREGLLTMVRNRAVLFPQEGAAQPAALNDAFQVGDRMRVYPDSAVRVLFMEDSFLNVGANTTYDLTKSRYDEITGARDIGFGLVAGKVRLAVGRLFGRGSASIDTPTAVVGVKGTDVHVAYDEESHRTLILVYQGQVEVTPKDPALSGTTTTVPAGSYTEVEEGPAPPVVEVAPPSLIESTQAETDVFSDPVRTTPEATVADASTPPPPPTTVVQTDVTEAVVSRETVTVANVAGGQSSPVVSQTSSNTGLDQPIVLPSATVPPDQCPGCP
jgi:hypothetical protein